MFRTSPLFLALSLSLSTLFILFALLYPGLNESSAPWIVVLSVFLIGIPHGAIDHVVSSELFGTGQNLKGHLLFYGSYLIIMLLLGLIWIFIPVAGMIIFLIISIYHFGQADMEDFLISKKKNPMWYIARGFFLIGLIVFSSPDVTYAIISTAMNISSDLFYSMMPPRNLSLLIILLIYASFILSSVLKKEIQDIKIFILESTVLVFLFLISGPLIGFALYFAIWHSSGHIVELQQFFESKNKELSILQFYKLATPFTLISILGLIFLLYIQNIFQVEDQFLTLMFILISVLTLPHMLIVDRMYSDRNKSES